MYATCLKINNLMVLRQVRNGMETVLLSYLVICYLLHTVCFSVH